MHTRTLIAIGSLVAPLLCFAGSRDQECKDWTTQAIEKPTIGCEGACSQAKRFDKYDYHAGLIAAHANLAGLEAFVRYTARSTIMGAGADEQACHLYALLLRWGDKPFSETLAKAGKKSKVRVVGLLDYAAVDRFQVRFPLTYGLVQKHDE